MQSVEKQRETVFPGGYGRSAVYVGPHPPQLVRGAGSTVWDEDGNELFDLSNNFTVLVHGHAHPELVRETRVAVADGSCFGLHNPYELPHAQALLDRIESAEQVRYTVTGTEATLAALRMVRSETGRDKVVVVSNAFHGMADPTLVAAVPASRRGISPAVREETLTVPNNDVAALERLFAEQGGEIAGLFLDLIPNNAGLIAVTPEFAAAARRLTRAAGARLIVDEIISLRMAVGGFQATYGLTPDLTLLGKLIGGGFAIGAIVGSREAMARLDPAHPEALLHGGTFSGNPVTMRVGLKALELLDAEAIDHINSLGELLRSSLREAGASEAGWEIRGAGSLARTHPAPGSRRPLCASLWWRVYERGVLLTPAGLASISTPTTEAQVVNAAEAIAAAMHAKPNLTETPIPRESNA